MPEILIICPTFDHADTLFASIASVRTQRFTDWEMVVIGDGAPPRTQTILESICSEDPRIRFEQHPKSERFGEIYRDPVIRASRSDLVCHLSDDDIWTPDHLDQMLHLAEQAEWVNQAPLRVPASGGAEWWPINHATEPMRHAIRRRVGISAGINYVAYRRETYLRLPEGWTCAPWEAGTSDVYMWSKFFHLPSLNVASSAVTSAIKFPSTLGERRGRTPEQRMAEITPWLARAAEPGLANRACRSASVLTRMLQLFSLHRCGVAHSSVEALAQAGLDPVSAEMAPKPALNGAPMVLPLTKRQRAEVEDAWVLLRACQPDGHEAAAAQAQLTARYQSATATWLSALRMVSRFAGGAAAEIGAEHLLGALPDHPTAHAAAADMLLSQRKLDRAREVVERIEARWPAHGELPRLLQAVSAPAEG